jgi:hypothetical protein
MKTTSKRYSADFKAKVALRSDDGGVGRKAWCLPHDDRVVKAAGRRGDGGHIFRCGRSGQGSERRGGGQAACKDRAAAGRAGFFSESLRSMSVARKRSMIEPAHHRLSIAAHCRLLSISRSSYYYAPVSGDRRDAGADASDRRGVPRHAMVRQSADGPAPASASARSTSRNVTSRFSPRKRCEMTARTWLSSNLGSTCPSMPAPRPACAASTAIRSAAARPQRM